MDTKYSTDSAKLALAGDTRKFEEELAKQVCGHARLLEWPLPFGAWCDNPPGTYVDGPPEVGGLGFDRVPCRGVV